MAELPGSNNQTFPGHCPLYQGALFLLSLMYQSLSLTFKKKKKGFIHLFIWLPGVLVATWGIFAASRGVFHCGPQTLQLWHTGPRAPGLQWLQGTDFSLALACGLGSCGVRA